MNNLFIIFNKNLEKIYMKYKYKELELLLEELLKVKNQQKKNGNIIQIKNIGKN